MDAIGGVLCRCTGYRKIIARRSATPRATAEAEPSPEAGAAVGARVRRLDGGAQGRRHRGLRRRRASRPMRCSRAPSARPITAPRFTLRRPRRPSSPRIRASCASSRPPTCRARTCYGVIPPFADQPVFAEGEARFRGEAVAAVVGERAPRSKPSTSTDFPVTWKELPPLDDDGGRARLRCAAASIGDRPGNILMRGRVARGDVEAALADGRRRRSKASSRPASSSTPISSRRPAAPGGSAIASRSQACTQSPYHGPRRRRRRSSASRRRRCASSRPPSAAASAPSSISRCSPSWRSPPGILNRPVRMVYSRPESMMTTTKRHPATHPRPRRRDPRRQARRPSISTADFNTGAYASWGPTVANRVPVHASGPYCRAALPRPDPRRPHASRAGRRLPRLRRAAGGDRPGAAL